MDSGLRQCAHPRKMQGNERQIETCARLTWLLKVQRIASPTYRSTIDDDQRASDLICWMGTPIGLLKSAANVRRKHGGLARPQLRGCEVRERLDGLDDFVLLYCGAHCARKQWEIVRTVQTTQTVTKSCDSLEMTDAGMVRAHPRKLTAWVTHTHDQERLQPVAV